MEGYPDFLTEISNSIHSKIVNQLDNHFIEGLKRKGFEFEDKEEMIEFIKKHCRCEDDVSLKERIYYVNEIPFFLHYYDIEINQNLVRDNEVFKVTANYGHYAYL